MSELAQHPNAMERDLDLIKLELDKDGSPVAIEPRGWFVCIVPGLVKQWWHPFVHERHKHVFAMRPAGPGQWTLFEPWWHRLLTATITSEQARKFLMWGAHGDVLHVREAVPGRGSQVRGWMTCATRLPLTSWAAGTGCGRRTGCTSCCCANRASAALTCRRWWRSTRRNWPPPLWPSKPARNARRARRSAGLGR